MWIKRKKPEAREPGDLLDSAASPEAATPEAGPASACQEEPSGADGQPPLSPAALAAELEALQQRVARLEVELSAASAPPPSRAGARLARAANDVADLATVGLIVVTLGAWILSPLALALGALALSRAHLTADPKAVRAQAIWAMVKACLTLIAAAVLLEYILNYLSTRI